MFPYEQSKIEEEILKFWQKNKIFEKSLEKRRKSKKFVFYEGPPTANGLPHIGHFLGRAFKDLFLRYKTMRGYFVPRRAGWDTHGLPVEIEVEKELKIKSKPEIEKYGVAKFNKKAKESVWRYKKEWETFTKRIGFWLDLDNPYITYNNEYIESLWWIIKEIAKRGLLYKGFKVLAWCPRCETALSSHEVAQGYKSISENSIYVKFKLKNPKKFGLKEIYLLAWTTTPWTLPGNTALTIGEKIKYAIFKVKGEKEEKFYIAAEKRIPFIAENYEIVKEIKSKDLIGLDYEPLFKIENLKSKKSYKVYFADFVNLEEGTGIVHTALMYGEEDYEFGEKIGLPKFHTVEKNGKFKNVPGFEGRFVKEAEEDIVKYLERKGFLFKIEPYTHDYPFCWRCDSPLLYYAGDSWFIKTSAIRKKLIANNKKINWIPQHIKEGRFGQWLKEVKDWAFSRARFWGTPLPIWQCQSENQPTTVGNQLSTSKFQPLPHHFLVVGSLADLEKNRYYKGNKYYILRHCESRKNNFDGRGSEIINTKLENDNFSLTEKGVKQAKEVAKKLKKEKIDLIFTSPFLRTKETAKIIAQELNLGFEIDQRLKELDHGSICEGQDHYLCVSKEEYPNLDFNKKFGLDGESRNDAKKRMFDFIKEMESKYQGKKILLVSHADPLWLLEGISKNLNEEELFKVKSAMLKGEKPNSKLPPLKLGEFRIIRFKNYPRDEFGNFDLHRPYVDEIFLKCEKCRGLMKRIPDLVDVWFDSGAMPFSQNHWPFSKKKIDFPADFICEGVDQTRGWFFTLLAVSTLLGYGPSYKNVISLGHILDEKGRKMSKSLGNVVIPEEMIKKFGADIVRLWFFKVNPAGETKLFREKELEEIKTGFLRVILNSLNFLELYSKKEERELKGISRLNLLDKWLLSRWNSLVKLVTEALDNYDATTSIRAIEKFVIEDLSNWWIRRSRQRFQIPTSDSSPQKLLRLILLELSKLIAPFTPFLAEYLFNKVKKQKTEISVHLCDWPKFNQKLINKKLEKDMDLVRKVVGLGLRIRKGVDIKVRQPLNSLYLKNYKLDEFSDLIKEELNIKNIYFVPQNYKVPKKQNFIEGREGDLVIFLDTEVTPSLKIEGLVREFIRVIQDSRKEAKYKFDQKVNVFWFCEDKNLREALRREIGFIKSKLGLKGIKEEKHNPKFVYDFEKEIELEPGRKIWLGLKL